MICLMRTHFFALLSLAWVIRDRPGRANSTIHYPDNRGVWLRLSHPWQGLSSRVEKQALDKRDGLTAPSTTHEL
ncbi:hypothetical protein F5B18DRAFT_637071 [Nemania serpens]|nr:hypothetical protein F5B18DRAFT_637071 [Nemania serpens]